MDEKSDRKELERRLEQAKRMVAMPPTPLRMSACESLCRSWKSSSGNLSWRAPTVQPSYVGARR
jgi:hypothetical protein